MAGEVVGVLVATVGAPRAFANAATSAVSVEASAAVTFPDDSPLAIDESRAPRAELTASDGPDPPWAEAESTRSSLLKMFAPVPALIEPSAIPLSTSRVSAAAASPAVGTVVVVLVDVDVVVVADVAP